MSNKQSRVAMAKGSEPNLNLLAEEEHCVLELQTLGENIYDSMPADLKDSWVGSHKFSRKPIIVCIALSPV